MKNYFVFFLSLSLFLSGCSFTDGNDYKKEPGILLFLGNSLKNDAMTSIVVSSDGRQVKFNSGLYSIPSVYNNEFLVMGEGNELLRISDDMVIHRKELVGEDLLPSEHVSSFLLNYENDYLIGGSGGFSPKENRYYNFPVVRAQKDNLEVVDFKNYNHNVGFSTICGNNMVSFLMEKDNDDYHVLSIRNLINEREIEIPITSRFESGEYLSPGSFLCNSDDIFVFANKILEGKKKPVLLKVVEGNKYETIVLSPKKECSSMLNDSFVYVNNEFYYGSYNGALCRMNSFSKDIHKITNIKIEGNSFSDKWIFRGENGYLLSRSIESNKIIVTKINLRSKKSKTGVVNYDVPDGFFLKKFIVLDDCLDLSCLTSYDFKTRQTFEVSAEWNDYLNTLSVENKNKLSRVIKYTNLSKKEYDEHLAATPAH